MKSKRIRGFPVISLGDGSMEGRVQDIVIDPAQKKIEGILVGEKGFLKGRHRFIDFNAIHSIGSDAVTIKEMDAESLEISPNLELLKDYSIIGKSLISNEGNYIAKILDFTFSTQTGQIESLLLHDIKGREPIDMDVFLTVDGILNLGKDYIIADSNFTHYLVEENRKQEAKLEEETKQEEETLDPEDVSENPEARQAHIQNELFQDDPLQDEPYEETTHDKDKETRGQETPPHDGYEKIKEAWSRVEAEVSRGSQQLARESKERMKQYVRNKKASYSVWDPQGNVLVHKGEVISDETIENAEVQGKIPQLFFSVVSEEIEESLNVIGDKISRIFR